MFKKLKENKKGFTLVELIVVLVILAILAALLVPALTGYIDKAKRKSIVAETRQAVMAAQTLVDEAYGKQVVGGTVTVGTGKGDTVQISEVATLAELNADNIKSVTVGTGDDAGKVTKLVYSNKGKWCTYDVTVTDGTDGMYNVTDKDPASK